MFKIKVISKIFFLIIIFISFGLSSNAQNRKMEFAPSIGLVANHDEFEDFEYGWHFGLNVYKREEKRFKTDLQISINVSGTNTSSTLFSLNGLYGVRYHIINPDNLFTVFANALVGGSLAINSGDDFTENLSGLGYSVGVFADFKRIVAGVSAESYNNFIVKVGYTF